METLHQAFVRKSQEQIQFVENKPDCVDFHQGCVDAFNFFQTGIKSKELFLETLKNLSLDDKKRLLRNIDQKIESEKEKTKIKVYYFTIQNKEYISLDKDKLISCYVELINQAQTRKEIKSQFSDKQMFLDEFNQYKEKSNVTTID